MKFWKLELKFDKNYFPNQFWQPLCDVLHKEIDNLDFVQGVNFEYIDSLENNGTTYLVIFDKSY